MELDEVKAILSEYKVHNADVKIYEPNCTTDQLIDVIEGNRKYVATNSEHTFQSKPSAEVSAFEALREAQSERQNAQ